MTRPTIQEFLAGLPDYVEQAVYFTSVWVTPPEGSPDVDLLTKPDLCQEFKEGFTQPAPLPAPDWLPGQPDEDVGGNMDIREATLRDMWQRQGVAAPPNGSNAFWDYALTQARAWGRTIIPQPSQDGTFENHNDPVFAIAYTIPAMFATKGQWVVMEGLPL